MKITHFVPHVCSLYVNLLPLLLKLLTSSAVVSPAAPRGVSRGRRHHHRDLRQVILHHFCIRMEMRNFVTSETEFLFGFAAGKSAVDKCSCQGSGGPQMVVWVPLQSLYCVLKQMVWGPAISYNLLSSPLVCRGPSQSAGAPQWHLFKREPRGGGAEERIGLAPRAV